MFDSPRIVIRVQIFYDMVYSKLFAACLLFLLIFLPALNGETKNSANDCRSDNSALPVKLCDSEYGTEHNGLTVSKNVSYIFTFGPVPEGTNDTHYAPPRINIHSTNANSSHHILVIASLGDSIMAWKLPLRLKHSNVSYSNSSRTLCIEDPASMRKFPLKVSVTSNCEASLHFSLRVDQQHDFVIKKLNEERDVTLTAFSPQMFFFDTTKLRSSVLLTVKSSNDVCMSLSIHDAECPVRDRAHTESHREYHQTISTKGGLVLLPFRYRHGMFILFNVHGNNSACDGKSSKIQEGKCIQFKLEPHLTLSEFKFAAWALIYLFVVISIAVLMLLFVSKRIKTPPSGESFAMSPENPELPEDDMNETKLSAIPLNGGPPSQNDEKRKKLYEKLFSIFRIERDKCMYLADLAKKNPKKIETKSQLYFWNIATIAIFYSLPVTQLMYTNQRVLNSSGDQDVCYYNFLCSNRLFEISDFNHVYSNISYIFFGTLFMILTWRKEAAFDFESNKGIPAHFGLAHALGAALIVEGIMSACYHICPSDQNIQFDTTFMYIMSILSTLKIYQTRHPDVNASAYATSFVFACVIVVGVFGILNISMYFYILFTPAHLLFCAFLSLKIYYTGRWKLGISKFKGTVIKFLKNPVNTSKYCNPKYPHHMRILIIGNVFNWILEIILLKWTSCKFSMFLIVILMANFVLYAFYYICMKIAQGEKILPTPLICILLSIVCWAFAAVFYIDQTMDWALKPAESRKLNRPCLFLEFYDEHDFWHLFSATGLFLTFVALLTLDDDLQNIDRSKIPVF